MRHLAPAEVVRVAVRRLGERWRALARALVIPGVMLATLNATQDLASDLGWAAAGVHFAVYSLVYSVFAVSCHRIVLLPQADLPNRFGLYFTAREGRFFCWTFVITLMVLPPIVPAAFPVGISFAFLPEGISGIFSGALLLVACLPGWYIFARASLVLPATALDQRPSMSKAWRLSHANGSRLSVALGIPLLSVLGVGAVLEAGFGEASGPVSSLVSAFGLALLGACEIAVLTVSFRVLDPQPDAAAAA